MTTLARLALAELHQRKASVDAAVNAGTYPREKGEQLLRCWLSIALAAGARPGECSSLLGMWAEDAGLDDRHARLVLLDDGPPRTEWLAELARARDAAGSKARANPTDMKLSLRHHALDSLCIYLGGRPEHAQKQDALTVGETSGADNGDKDRPPPVGAPNQFELEAA